MFRTLLNNKLYISPAGSPKEVRKNRTHLVLPSKLALQPVQRKPSDELIKLDADALLSHIDSRLMQQKNNISKAELKDLSQAFINKAAECEISYLKKLNKILIKIEQISFASFSGVEYGYLLRYLLKKMLDAEYQEECILYFKSFNDIVEDLHKKYRVELPESFRAALMGMIDIRFVYLDSKKEHETQTYKNFGKIVAAGIGSMPISHPVFSGISWWNTGMGAMAEKIHASPFSRPPLALKTKVTNFIANHAAHLFIGAIVLAGISIAAPFVIPLILPVITPAAVSIAFDTLTAASLASTGISAIIFWHKERQKTNRIEKRLNKTAEKIENFENGIKACPHKKANLAYIIKQLYTSSKPRKKIGQTLSQSSIQGNEEKLPVSDSFPNSLSRPPILTPYLISSNPLLETMDDEEETIFTSKAQKR